MFEMFGRKREVEHKGLMVKLFQELLSGDINKIIVEENMILVDCGSYALKYTPHGAEIAVEKTGNEIYDIVLARNLEKEFKALAEGEAFYTMKVYVEPKMFQRVQKIFEKTQTEYRQFIEKLKGEKKNE